MIRERSKEVSMKKRKLKVNKINWTKIRNRYEKWFAKQTKDGMRHLPYGHSWQGISKIIERYLENNFRLSRKRKLVKNIKGKKVKHTLEKAA